MGSGGGEDEACRGGDEDHGGEDHRQRRRGRSGGGRAPKREKTTEDAARARKKAGEGHEEEGGRAAGLTHARPYISRVHKAIILEVILLFSCSSSSQYFTYLLVAITTITFQFPIFYISFGGYHNNHFSAICFSYTPWGSIFRMGVGKDIELLFNYSNIKKKYWATLMAIYWEIDYW
jgi:hypothetical protein